MSFWDKIKGPAIALGGSALLGNFLFPETTAALTGGLLGSSPAGGVGSVIASGQSAGGGLMSGLPMFLKDSGSIWNNPTVLSSGILAGTSLLSNLFGSNAEEDAAKLSEAQLAEQQRQFDAELAYKQAALAQALEIAKIQAGAGGGGGSGAAVAAANIARDSQLRQAMVAARQMKAQLGTQAAQLPMQARQLQATTAQQSGANLGSFYNNLIANLQRPALSGG